MPETKPVVFVLDDDESVREGLGDLLHSVGLGVQTFKSVQEFLENERPNATGCIVLDVRLPGRSGLDFQSTLSSLGIELPVIFISGHSDIPISVRAMKSGAIEFLTKPVREQELLDAVQKGIEHDRARRRDAAIVADVKARYDSLTPREREIMSMLITGKMNKQMAGQADLSEATIKVHRSNLMRKMRAKTLVELVRMADRLGLSPGETASKPKQ
jgi:FixJ family two-component response regulator